jgi:hypothetical protein
LGKKVRQEADVVPRLAEFLLPHPESTDRVHLFTLIAADAGALAVGSLLPAVVLALVATAVRRTRRVCGSGDVVRIQ